MGGHRKKRAVLKARRAKLAPRPMSRTSEVAKTEAAILKPLEVSLADLADLAVEWWRLDRWTKDETRLVGRRVARRLDHFLKHYGIETVDLTGKPYDAGLAVEILETRDGPDSLPNFETIGEMISPIVLCRGTLVKHGQAVKHGRPQR